MSNISVKAISSGHSFRSKAFLSAVRYDTEMLVVMLASPGDGISASTVFTDVVGFRVLGEGDLIEFWPHCASDHGWLFRIDQGGWFDQEVARRGFLHEKTAGLHEYFIASQNECVSVLSGSAPKVEVAAI